MVWRAIYPLLLVVLAASCATRPFESADLRDDVPIGAVALFNDAQQPVAVKPGVKRRPHLQVLAISGGGAAGAFGAGVLAGWTKAGNRPSFDIVTGVSTGALIAVLAFLGPKYDGLLKEVYTTTSNDGIFRTKGPLSVFSDSLLNSAPFKRKIKQVVTREMLDEVAQAHRNGRRLYVATTNLDAGKLVVWDMGRIAASGHAASLRAFRRVLRASAAVPGFFKPVYIQAALGSKARQMHVDGGVKAPVLIRAFMFNVPAKRRTLHVIINGQMRLFNAASAVKPKVLDISRRSIDELMRGLTYKTLYQGYVAARNAGAVFRLVRIPDEAEVSDSALKFDPKEMTRLYTVGLAMGGDPAAWKAEPPRLEKNERISNQRRAPRRRR
jgi:predicted acylesterase/phospholipase RssA